MFTFGAFIYFGYSDPGLFFLHPPPALTIPQPSKTWQSEARMTKGDIYTLLAY